MKNLALRASGANSRRARDTGFCRAPRHDGIYAGAKSKTPEWGKPARADALILA